MVLDTETGRSLIIRQRNYYQSTFEYWFQDGSQKYELSLYQHYMPNVAEKGPLEKVISHVEWFLRVNYEGNREDNPQLEQQSDYQKYKLIIEEMLLAYAAEGREPDEIEYEMLICLKSAPIAQSLG